MVEKKYINLIYLSNKEVECLKYDDFNIIYCHNVIAIKHQFITNNTYLTLTLPKPKVISL